MKSGRGELGVEKGSAMPRHTASTAAMLKLITEMMQIMVPPTHNVNEFKTDEIPSLVDESFLRTEYDNTKTKTDVKAARICSP